MMRFSFVFLFIAMSLLSAAAAAAASVRDIPLDESKTSALKNDEVECGIGLSGANVNERIIGGEEAEPHAWPWQALVACRPKRGDRPVVCGGSLIADKWVITAAHCVFNMIGCAVSLGRHYSFTSNKTEPAEVTTGIKKYFVHENYDDSRLSAGFDIALLKLEETVQYNKNIKPICLPFDLPELEDTSVCYATGWGRNDRNNSFKYPETLKQLLMPFIHDGNSYNETEEGAIELQIFASSMNLTDDICQGDSGGPLACIEEDGKWYLRGVASFVPEGCYLMAGFTKVTAFRDWITEKIASN